MVADASGDEWLVESMIARKLLVCDVCANCSTAAVVRLGMAWHGMAVTIFAEYTMNVVAECRYDEKKAGMLLFNWTSDINRNQNLWRRFCHKACLHA